LCPKTCRRKYNMNRYCTIEIHDSQAKCELVAPNLWVVDNCFGPDTLSWMQGIVDSTGNTWTSAGLDKRLELKEENHDYQRLKSIGKKQAGTIGNIVEKNLNFMDVKFWLDLPQFGCQVHSDSEDIVVSYQVYVYKFDDSSTVVRGAEFLHVEPPYRVEIEPNKGYLNYNIDAKEHWVYGGHGIRHSVMFQYCLAT